MRKGERTWNVRIRNVFNVSNQGTLVCDTVKDQTELTGIALTGDFAALDLQIDSAKCDAQRIESLHLLGRRHS